MTGEQEDRRTGRQGQGQAEDKYSVQKNQPCRTLDKRGNPNHNIKIPPDNPRIKGWRTFTPFDCAIAPTANGRTAAPPPPNAAANPIELTWRCRGRSLVVMTTAAGKRGPRKNPWRATATAEA